MIVEIISTGEEVLSGQIVDTNAAHISSVLMENNIEIAKRFTVGDRIDDLVALFQERSKIADYVVVTGGLGPTSDDLTSRAMAKALGEPLAFFQEWWEALETRFERLNRTLDPQNRQQATLPKSATIIDNPLGTACGFVVLLNRATFYFLPGVPSEMKRMFQESVLPMMLQSGKLGEKVDVEVFQTFGISESRLGRELSQIVLPSSITLGYRPRLPTVEVKILCRNASLADREIVKEKIKSFLGAFIYSDLSESLSARVQKLLMARKETLCAAESCTGGMLSSAIIDNAGSSQVFECGYVCYSNKSKTQLLSIDAALIEDKGAVSSEVAIQMAKQSQKKAGTDYSLAISGIAGPDGGTNEKPVGTVVFALAAHKDIFCQALALPNWGRLRIREISTAIALDMLRRHLLSLPVLADYDFTRRMDL